MYSEGASVELIPGRVEEAKGSLERSGGLDTEHGKNSGTEDGAASEEEEIVRSAGATEAAWRNRCKASANTPCIEPSGK